MDHREELLKHVNQLLRILRQIMKSGGANPFHLTDESGKHITINICLFDLLAEEEGEVELWDSKSEELPDADSSEEWLDELQALKFEVTPRDNEFLRSHGIKF